VKCGEGRFKDFEFNALQLVCMDKCGDGKRFTRKDYPDLTSYLQCDDGNKEDGDGCDKNCVVETKWICSGGSSTQPDKCVEVTPPTA
jgi:cysteine-rich repeat protein